MSKIYCYYCCSYYYYYLLLCVIIIIITLCLLLLLCVVVIAVIFEVYVFLICQICIDVDVRTPTVIGSVFRSKVDLFSAVVCLHGVLKS